MTSLTVLRLPHLPDQAVHVGFFKEVQNAAFLRQQLLEANADFEYAFLDATTILSTQHLLAAVFRAVNDMLHSRLKTRNVHSEIVFSLSPNNNIAESFRRFGISDTTTSLITVKIPLSGFPNAEAIENHLMSAVQGTSILFTDANIQTVSDIAKIRKLYKLGSGSGGKGGKGKTPVNGVSASQASDVNEMAAVIIGTMALKGS